VLVSHYIYDILIAGLRNKPGTGRWWLTFIILATQEAAMRKITVEVSLGKQFARTYLGKKTSQERADGVAQSVVHEFKPRSAKKRNKPGPIQDHRHYDTKSMGHQP
jgi:hypothetical protein